MRIIMVLFLSLFFVPTVVFAQLKVDASGRTIFGATAKTYTTGLSVYDNGGTTPFRMFRSSDDAVYFTRTTDIAAGFRLSSTGKLIMGQFSNGTSAETGRLSINTENVMGLYVRGQHTTDAVELVRFYVNRSLATTLAGYNGSSKTFYLRGDGAVYATTFNTTSDISIKKNIETISNPLEKVLRLRGVSYEYKDLTAEEEVEMASVNSEIIDEDGNEASINQNYTLRAQIEAEQLRKRIGFIAQEVEEVVPEVVRTTDEGLKTVAYQELVGLLVEAIKEQQEQIDRLMVMVENASEVQNALNLEGEVKTLHAELRVNVPNPFKEETRISYVLPKEVKTAVLYIYDMQGKQLKSERITDRGEGFVIIRGSELSAGMYIYSLIADGKEIGTHRMILTK